MTEEITADPPLISVLIGMPHDNAAVVTEVINGFAAQTMADRIEVLVITPRGTPVSLPMSSWTALAAVRIVETDPFETFPDGIVAGVEHAHGKIVALYEDHAFVSKGWDKAVIDAHMAGYGVVSVLMDNANPRTGRSWVHFLNDLGQHLRGEPAGEKADLPAHNVSYFRDDLLRYSRQELSRLISLYLLNKELGQQGRRLYLSDGAVCFHQNASKWAPSVWLRYRVHRLRAGMRARLDHWSLGRRIGYVLLTPLIPFVRMLDVLRNLRRQRRLDLLQPRIVAAVALFAFVNAAGELVGLIAGPGSTDALGRIEFRRYRQMCAADLANPTVGGAHLERRAR